MAADLFGIGGIQFFVRIFLILNSIIYITNQYRVLLISTDE